MKVKNMKLTGKKILYASHVVTVEAENETHCRIRFVNGAKYVIAKTGIEAKNIFPESPLQLLMEL